MNADVFQKKRNDYKKYRKDANFFLYFLLNIYFKTKMNSKDLSLIVCFALFLNSLSAQSFQIAEIGNSGFFLSDFQINQDLGISLSWDVGGVFNPIDTVFCLTDLSQNDLTAKGYKFSIKEYGKTIGKSLGENLYTKLFSQDNYRFFKYLNSLICLDMNLGDGWIKTIKLDQVSEIEYAGNANGNPTFLSSTFLDQMFFLTAFDLATGNIKQNFGYRLPPGPSQTNLKFFQVEYNKFNNSFLMTSAVFERDAPPSQLLLRINEDGKIESEFLLEDVNFPINNRKKRIFVSPSGDVYLLGIKRYAPGTVNKGELYLLKFDQNLNLQYSKQFYVDRLPCSAASLSFKNNGNPILVYAGRGVYPIILAELNSRGEVVRENGLAIYTPQVHVSGDGDLYMMTNRHFKEDGSTYPLSILVKTDEEGNVENCENYEARLKESDFDVTISDIGFDSIPPLEYENGEFVDVRPFEIEFEPFCDLPDFPVPDFLAPDTVCLGECIRIDSVKNQNTNGREWSLESDNINLTVADSFEFSHCFTEPGTYSLQQTIWMLGVDYSYEKIIEVLPPLEINIQPDSILCESPTLLRLNSNRPLQNIEWSTGATEPEIYSLDSGIHSVTGEDGYCRAGDTAFLEFIFEKIDTNLAIELSDSVTACEVHLPFKLKPTSDYSIVFSDKNAELDSVFLLSKPGDYFFSTEVFGCRFSKKIAFKTDACKAEIFTPSAFSPNNDGINDEFIPLGENIESLRLEIYDRWGGKVFVSNDSQMAWDGNFDGKTVSKGVYVFRFEYLNLLTGLPEEISGDVSVLK